MDKVRGEGTIACNDTTARLTGVGKGIFVIEDLKLKLSEEEENCILDSIFEVIAVSIVLLCD